MIAHAEDYALLRDSWAVLGATLLEIVALNKRTNTATESMRATIVARIQVMEADLRESSEILNNPHNLISESQLETAALLVLHASEQLVAMTETVHALLAADDTRLIGNKVGEA